MASAVIMVTDRPEDRTLDFVTKVVAVFRYPNEAVEYANNANAKAQKNGLSDRFITGDTELLSLK